jgi:hypothetical protein
VVGSSQEILPDELPESLTEAVPPRDPELSRFHVALRQTKRRLIVEAFRQANGSYTETAHLLGLHPNYFTA